MLNSQQILDGCTIFIVDPDAETRAATRSIVASIATDVAAFETTDELLARYVGNENAILICEMRPGLSGLVLLQQLKERGNYLPTVFTTTEPTLSMGIYAIRCGALDILAKPIDEQALWPVLRQAMNDYTKNRRLHDVLKETREGMAALTDAQKRVLRLWMLGKKNKAIANELGVSQRTVESCRQRIRNKLNASSRELLAAKVALVGEFPFPGVEPCDAPVNSLEAEQPSVPSTVSPPFVSPSTVIPPIMTSTPSGATLVGQTLR